MGYSAGYETVVELAIGARELSHQGLDEVRRGMTSTFLRAGLGQLIAALAATSSASVVLALLVRVSVGAERRNMRAPACRGATFAASLAAGALAVPAPAWSVCAVMALLLALLAVAIATPRPLLEHRCAPTEPGEPAWWREFVLSRPGLSRNSAPSLAPA